MDSLTWKAKAYLGLVLALGCAVLFSSLSTLQDSDQHWLTFAVLAALAATVQLFPVLTPKNQAYYLTMVFIFAGVLLLPPVALALLIVLTFIPEWTKAKYPWYIAMFNIANFLVDALTARTVYVLVLGDGTGTLAEPQGLIAALLAATVFTLLNHLLLAVVLHLARGYQWHKTGLFDIENLLTDATLSCTGIIAAIAWQANPWLLAVAGAPLFLIYRALNTPNLKEQASKDAKTGLYNSRHFYQIVKDEFCRAARFERPIAVIMADLDLLRNINNAYGHLAGDVVLKGVAEIIRRSLREYDIAARFGGEEFSILLPETDGQGAFAVAERLRKRVEEALFSVATSAQPIQATISLGIASFPAHGLDPDEIIHQADLAVYYAKLHGRNRTWACSPESVALGCGTNGFRNLGTIVETPFKGYQTPNYSATAACSAAVQAVHIISSSGPSDSQNGALQGEITASSTDPQGDANVRSQEGAQQRASRRERSSDLSWSVSTLIASVVLGALALWWVFRPWDVVTNWPGLGTLIVMTVLSQGLSIETYGRGRISIGAIFVLAGGFLFGMPGVLMLGLALGVATWVLRRGLVHRTLFDIGNTTLSGSAGLYFYSWLAGYLPGSEHLLLFIPAAVAALAYYAINVGLMSMVFSLIERRGPLSVWEEKYRWLIVHYLAYGVLAFVVALAYQSIGLLGLASFLVPPVMLRYAMKQYLDRTEKNVAELKRVNHDLAQSHDAVVSTLHELQRTYTATLTALSAALDSRDSETEGHSQRVVKYTEAIAKQMGLSEPEAEGLLKGALLHDIGKIGVPDAILRKPGPLTPEEWVVMKTHSAKGSRMLEHISFLGDALPIVRHHHEHYDGNGYPDGLRGEAIPLGARIFAVADAFDAMTSNRPYRRPCSDEVAREEIARFSGRQFDPQVVQAFLAVGNIRELAKHGAIAGVAEDWTPQETVQERVTNGASPARLSSSTALPLGA